MRVSDTDRRRINSHYRTYSETYQQIWRQLEMIHDRFQKVDRAGKIAYLKLSYINSVASIQTAAFNQEEAITRLIAGNDLETVLEPVNYNNQKQKYIAESLKEREVWENIASELQVGKVDSAHRTALNQLNYIGPVKAPFIFANLGYTEKMCFDTNVVQTVGLDDHPSTTDIDRYEQLCQELRTEFPTLRKELEPFHLHWVIFDWHRHSKSETTEPQKERDQTTPVTSHDAWFEAALSEPSRIQEVIESLP